MADSEGGPLLSTAVVETVLFVSFWVSYIIASRVSCYAKTRVSGEKQRFGVLIKFLILAKDTKEKINRQQVKEIRESLSMGQAH